VGIGVGGSSSGVAVRGLNSKVGCPVIEPQALKKNSEMASARMKRMPVFAMRSFYLI